MLTANLPRARGRYEPPKHWVSGEKISSERPFSFLDMVRHVLVKFEPGEAREDGDQRIPRVDFARLARSEYGVLLLLLVAILALGGCACLALVVCVCAPRLAQMSRQLREYASKYSRV